MYCTLDILVSRPDLGFIRLTVPHIVRGCRFPFRRRRLLVDTAPLSGQYAGRPGIGTMDELRSVCGALRLAGVVDTVEEIDYSEPLRRKIMTSHFGDATVPTHD